MPPLSRLDLPHIVEAIQVLYRTIADPPGENWQPQTWLVERSRRTTAGEEALRRLKDPLHSWLIGQAGEEVLDRLMPPCHHAKDDCPEISESRLDLRHKAKLLDLRKRLLWGVPCVTLAGNRSEADQFLDYLESLLKELQPGGIPGEQPGTADTVSAFPSEYTDPSRCPGCKAPVPEGHAIFKSKVLCQNCKQWELRTGTCVLPVAGPPGTPPTIIRLSPPLWEEVPGGAEPTGGQGGTGQGGNAPAKGKRGRKLGSDPMADRRLCEDWQAAKRQGMPREAFARERGITLQDLIDAQGREKYRRQRDAE